MNSPENPIEVLLFENPSEFNQYLRNLDEHPKLGGRAMGLQLPDGKTQIIIDRGYYLQAGIPEEQLDAIILHEQTELTTTEPEPHRAATFAEYRNILKHFGPTALREYHTRLSNLIGGLARDRKEVFLAVLAEAA